MFFSFGARSFGFNGRKTRIGDLFGHALKHLNAVYYLNLKFRSICWFKLKSICKFKCNYISTCLSFNLHSYIFKFKSSFICIDVFHFLICLYLLIVKAFTVSQNVSWRFLKYKLINLFQSIYKPGTFEVAAISLELPLPPKKIRIQPPSFSMTFLFHIH